MQSAWVLGRVLAVQGHTLDLPEPESPMVTILLIKLYGCVGWAMSGGGHCSSYAASL